MKYTRPVAKAPASLVKDGQCIFGTFNSPVESPDMSQVKNPLGWPLPNWINSLRLKQWQAYQIDCDDWFFCVAVYDTRSVGTAIIMAYNKVDKQMRVYEQKAPSFQLHVPCGLYNSKAHYQGKRLRMDFTNALAEDRFEIKIEATDFADLPDLAMQFSAKHSGEPIVICQPFGKNRPLFSHKALMPAEGSITWQGKSQDYKARVILDDHKGFYPYVMQYDWVTGLGLDSDGEPMGFNLTDNQILNPEHFNENCLWLKGKMYPLPPVTVERPEGVMGDWFIRDTYGQIDLTFSPLADVKNYLNLGIAETRYHGPTGLFKGRIEAAEVEAVQFDGCYGMGEKKYVRL